jgi:hypothetical protein
MMRILARGRISGAGAPTEGFRSLPAKNEEKKRARQGFPGTFIPRKTRGEPYSSQTNQATAREGSDIRPRSGG